MAPLGIFPLNVALWLVLSFSFCLVDVRVNAQNTPFNPPSFPLAVRTPFLNTWFAGGGNLTNTWPTFVQGPIAGWAGFVRVDDKPYRWMGMALGADEAVQISTDFTTTKSSFRFKAGPVTLQADFLSPIEDDPVKLSMPFSYLAVSVESNDGASHQVQVYSDISAEWLSGNRNDFAVWQTVNTNSTLIHQIQLQSPKPSQIINGQSEYSAVYYGTAVGSKVTYQVGQDAIVRAQFQRSGILLNSNDTKFREIANDFPVFGFASDMGTVTKSSDPVVFAIGVLTDGNTPVITLGTEQGAQPRFPYFLSQMDVSTAFTSFLADYPNAAPRADAVDKKVTDAANGVSTTGGLAGLVALTGRQAYGALILTTSKTSSGSFNSSDLLIFQGGGNIVDIIYPAFPAYLFLTPSLARYLLEPTLLYMEGLGKTDAFVPHDLGNFPNITGPGDNVLLEPIEESGNMLVMALAAALISGDGTTLQNHYSTLKGAADYLAANTLTPLLQFSTDNFLGSQANTSNLALKGILGVKAMGQIRSSLNISDTNPNYSDIASQLIQQWMGLAFPNNNAVMVSTYNNASSSALPYNLYPDVLLKTNLVPDSVYKAAVTYINANSGEYGIRLDSRQANTSKADWNIFMAASLKDTATRDKIFAAVTSYATTTTPKVPLSDNYNWVNASNNAGLKGRPVMGGTFAPLLLTLPFKPITIMSNSQLPSASGNGQPGPSPNNGDGGDSDGGGGDSKNNGALKSVRFRATFFVFAFGLLPVARFIFSL